MQLETAAEGGATERTERLRSGMMSEIKGGGVLDHEDGCVLSAALESPLSMGLKDRGRSDVLGAPEAVGSFGSSPRPGSLGTLAAGWALNWETRVARRRVRRRSPNSAA